MPALRRLPAALCLAGLLPFGTAFGASDIVISQLYGGNGTTYNADYVELFNRGSVPVSPSANSTKRSAASLFLDALAMQ